MQHLAIAQLFDLFGTQEPFLDRLLLNSRDVDPAAVIADFDVDLAAFVIGAKSQPALWRLACASAGRGLLDAVVAGVSNQVDQRIFNGLNDGAVQFRFGASQPLYERLTDCSRP